MVEGCRRLDVGTALLLEDRLLPLEIGEVDHQQAAPPLIVERPQHRMALADEQASARPQELRHDLPPAADRRQPAERSDAGVDEGEPLAPENPRMSPSRGTSKPTTRLMKCWSSTNRSTE
jgi:hypothetical protein